MGNDFDDFISYFNGDECRDEFRADYEDAVAHIRPAPSDSVSSEIAADSEARTIAILAAYHRWTSGF